MDEAGKPGAQRLAADLEGVGQLDLAESRAGGNRPVEDPPGQLVGDRIARRWSVEGRGPDDGLAIGGHDEFSVFIEEDEMELGLLIPQGYFSDFEGWEPRRAWERMVEIARLGERLGFGSIWVGEHVVAKWHPEALAFDGVTAMTALAALVPRVELGFIVINSTFRHPAMTAKMASTLDTVSDGRLILGLGAGFKENEAEWVGVDFPPVGRRLAVLGEHLEVISRMTRRDEPPVDFAGRARPGDRGGELPAHRRARSHPAAHRRSRQGGHVPAGRPLRRRGQRRRDAVGPRRTP